MSTFNTRHLADCKVALKTNQIRKMWHRNLMSLTADTERLKDLMVVLDAHSKKVMDKHYLLKDPEDDVVLAEALVKAVLGETVAFPTLSQAQEYAATHPEFSAMMERLDTECKVDAAAEECDEAGGESEEERDEQVELEPKKMKKKKSDDSSSWVLAAKQAAEDKDEHKDAD